MVFIKGKEYRNIYIDVDTKKFLEELSKETGIPQNRLIRKALELYKEVMLKNEVRDKAWFRDREDK